MCCEVVEDTPLCGIATLFSLHKSLDKCDFAPLALSDVRWAHNSKTEYQNSSVSIFLSNDQNMTLRMDLAASSSNASFLWGPNGAWGYEDHPLDPNEDDFIGGAVESTVSDSLWRVQAKIPWDFLPPDVIRIQVK